MCVLTDVSIALRGERVGRSRKVHQVAREVESKRVSCNKKLEG
jgi:hypothetical protein